MNTVGLTLFFLTLLITEALPLSIGSLLTVGLMPLLGVSDNFAGGVVGFAHPVIFFIIASFGIATAITSGTLTKRFLLLLLRRTGSVKGLLLALMVATAGVSFFMSNIPACAIMLVVALEFVDMLEGEEKASVGRTFMIAVPVATMIGGMATPASSSLNLISISLLEYFTYTHDYLTYTTVSFVHWMAIGVPLVVVLIPVAWMLMCRVYKPTEVSPEIIDRFRENIRVQVAKPLVKKEIFTLIILGGMLALWIASSWVSGIEVFTVALLGCVLLAMPGVRVLEGKAFVAAINWDIIFLSGAILSIAAALTRNDVISWLTDTLNLSALSLPIVIAVGLAALVTFVMLLLVTSAPALISVLAAPFAAIAAASGVPPAYLFIALAFCAGNCYLFPLDTVQLLTYSKGYYRMTDMGRSTIFLQIMLVIILALWIPFMGWVLGI